MIVQVTCERFCAGAVIENDRVIEAAPIIAFTVGWHRARFLTYFRKRYYKVEPVW